MARRRIRPDPDRPLPAGLQPHGRKFRARQSSRHSWTYFGEHYPDALKAFGAWKQSRGIGHDVAWLLDKFTGEVCRDRVKAGTLAQRTADDYLTDAVPLKKGVGHIPIDALAPPHVAKYRNTRSKKAPGHVRNEMACLSSAYDWAVELGLVKENPVRKVKRPPRRVRHRLIPDDEYVAVYARAVPSVKLAMTLIVRTLALPSDMLRIGPRNVVDYGNGRRTLRFRRGKTKVPVEVEIVGELAIALAPFLDIPTLHPTFVRKQDGTAYTVDGIGSMFRRYCDEKHAKVPDFGLRDLRAKGATDMYRAGVDIRHIQRLLGHKSVQTTEIYLKELLAEIVRPNERPILGLVK